MNGDDTAPVSGELTELVELLIGAKHLADSQGDQRLTTLIVQALFRLGEIIVAQSKTYVRDMDPD